MPGVFSPDSSYKKLARPIAILWTLLIIVGCFTPGNDLPRVDVPFFDKWAHLVLFGGFTFLWLCVRPILKASWLTALFIISAAFGSLIEVFQGILSFLGRSMELMDAVADAIGGIMGIALFAWGAYIFRKKD